MPALRVCRSPAATNTPLGAENPEMRTRGSMSNPVQPQNWLAAIISRIPVVSYPCSAFLQHECCTLALSLVGVTCTLRRPRRLLTLIPQ